MKGPVASAELDGEALAARGNVDRGLQSAGLLEDPSGPVLERSPLFAVGVCLVLERLLDQVHGLFGHVPWHCPHLAGEFFESCDPC